MQGIWGERCIIYRLTNSKSYEYLKNVRIVGTDHSKLVHF